MIDRRVLAAAVVIAVSAAGLSTACSSDNSGPQGGGSSGSCPNDLPKSCPSPKPSYKDDVAPLVERRCLVCHFEGGPASAIVLSSYPAIFQRRSAVLNQVYGCKMPPPDAGPLAEGDRQHLLGWLACDAPND